MAEYEGAVASKLKLKGVKDVRIKKRKKKKQNNEVVVEKILKSEEETQQFKNMTKKTPAELAFQKMQEKRNMEKCLEKASKTHKQRVEAFNRHLDSLTEHYDIPKVSWTK
ncbi:Protein fam32a [Chamberlinius hualienensis]